MRALRVTHTSGGVKSKGMMGVRRMRDEAVEVADGSDLLALLVGQGDGEGFFGAEDDFYGV